MVKWMDDSNTYSVLSNDQICDKSRQQDRHKLIGEVLDFDWEDESSPARVLDINNNKRKLEKKCYELAKDAAEQSFVEKDEILGKGRRIKKRKTVFEPIDMNAGKQSKPSVRGIENIKDNLIADLDSNDKNCENCDAIDTAMKDMKNVNDTLQQRLDKYKRKYKELHVRHLALEKATQFPVQADTVDIGNGVLVNKTLLEHKAAFYNTPPILARKLMEMIFTVQELKSSSLNGKQSNANKGMEALPALDNGKIAAIIEYTLTQYPNHPKEETKRKIKVSMSSFLRELRNEKIQTHRSEP